MKVILHLTANLFLAVLLIQVTYLLFFSVAGALCKKQSFSSARNMRRIRIFIPGYKEDKVILDTVRAALQQRYPNQFYDVVVIADSFAPQTLVVLRSLPITLVEVSFEKSTKGKALQKAIEATQHQPVDIALVLDADNHMSQGFLYAVNNAFEQGYEAVQGHRTAKTHNTAFALLDACTEEINNHIFRRGHVAVGMPSALIGSGMAFRWSLFSEMLQHIGDTAGEDKELEFRLMRRRKKIAFLDGVYVFDEKVSRNEVFAKQRSRWLAMQVEYFEKYFIKGWVELFKGNLAFFNKVVQTWLLPRVMLVALLCLWTCFCFVFLPAFNYINLAMVFSLALALALGIPARWYKKELLAAFLQIPGAFLGILKSSFHIGKARKQFIHTPHGEGSA